MPVMLPLAANEIFGKTHGGKIYQKLWFSVPLANMVGTNIVSRRKDAAYNETRSHAHYYAACALAQMKNADESLKNLEAALDNGFGNLTSSAIQHR